MTKNPAADTNSPRRSNASTSSNSPIDPSTQESSSPTNATPLRDRLHTDIPYPVIVTAAWAACALLIAGGVWLVGTFMGKVMIVVVPVAVAILLAALLAPTHELLTHRLRFPRALSALAAVLGLIAIVALGLTFAVNQFASGYVTLADKAQQGLDFLFNWLHTGPLHVPQNGGASAMESLSQFAKSNSDKLVTNAVDAGAMTVDSIAGVLICLIALFFFLYDGPRIGRYLTGWLPRNIQAPTCHRHRRALGGDPRATTIPHGPCGEHPSARRHRRRGDGHLPLQSAWRTVCCADHRDAQRCRPRCSNDAKKPASPAPRRASMGSRSDGSCETPCSFTGAESDRPRGVGLRRTVSGSGGG